MCEVDRAGEWGWLRCFISSFWDIAQRNDEISDASVVRAIKETNWNW